MQTLLLKRLAIAAASLLIASLAGTEPAYAHGFGQRYDLPVPLWLYLTGAGATVAVSFLIVGFFLRGTPGLQGYPRVNLLRFAALRWLAHPAVLGALRLFTVFLLFLVIAAGLFGSQNSLDNIAPTAVWVVWWVGLAFFSALVGNIWAAVNPWGTLFDWADALYRRINAGDRLSAERPYPEWLGYWPAVVLFLAFAWIELVYPGAAIPLHVAGMITVYTFITLAGMVVFGKRQWLEHGEAFSVAFGLLARVSPTEAAVAGPGLCARCSQACADGNGSCVDCYECFAGAGRKQRQVNLRPYGAGLLSFDVASPSLMAFVLLLLSTVTYDGFTATPLYVDIVGSVLPAFRFLEGQTVMGIKTLGLLVFPFLFLGVYTGFSWLMTALGGQRDWLYYARVFVFSLVPIALAYHLAHYLSYLLIQGQGIIPLLSDPLGWGWDLLGTAGYTINIAIVNARFAWIAAVIAIVLGHILAVYVAHMAAVRRFPDRRTAILSQYPMLVLMVLYTMISLWIIAQDTVEV